MEERDNLLRIRDQLTVKINETLADEAAREADADVSSEIAELQTSLQRLTEQREQLALDLSDARMELSIAREAPAAREPDAEDETQEYRLNAPELFSSMLTNLRTPMTSISDYTDLLLAESIGILGAAQRQVLSMIATDVDRVAGMIAEIQRVSTVDSSGFALEHDSIDLIAIIEDVIEEATESFSHKSHMVELALDDQLPPVNADGASLKHILAQLVANASAVSPEGSSIAVSAHVSRLPLMGGADLVSAVEIRVSDKGGGMARDDMQRVFARSYRAENSAIAGYGDSGVGMTVARAFARAHSGDLWITSDLGEGSVFHLALPLELAASIED